MRSSTSIIGSWSGIGRVMWEVLRVENQEQQRWFRRRLGGNLLLEVLLGGSQVRVFAVDSKVIDGPSVQAVVVVMDGRVVPEG